jgi:hypothetical protein
LVKNAWSETLPSAAAGEIIDAPRRAKRAERFYKTRQLRDAARPGPALPLRLNGFVGVEICKNAGAWDCRGWASPPGTAEGALGWRGRKRFFKKRFFQNCLSRQKPSFPDAVFEPQQIFPFQILPCPRQPVAPSPGSSFVNNNLPA